MPFKLNASPTFRAKVAIPIPGGDPESVEFEFRHRTVDGLQTLREECAGMTNRQIFDAVVVGWSLTDEFNQANTETLLQNYPMAARAIFMSYIAELTNARLGN